MQKHPAPRLHVVEVAPRDGLQNVDVAVGTADKVELVRRAAASGLKRIEVTSFVNPSRVPQMADAEDVLAGVRDDVECTITALALNVKGAQRAIRAGVDEVTYVLLATETFNGRNQGCSIRRSLQHWAEIARLCQEAGVRTSFMVGAAFGCPFEGNVDPAGVLALVDQAVASQPDELALADTIGCAVPTQVTQLFGELERRFRRPMRAHFHNTRNTGYANAFAAIEAGVTALDASIGGIGGCPFAPAATGNISTEDLVWMLERAGLDIGADLQRLVETADWMRRLGLPTDSLLPKAGPFPAVSATT